MAKKKTRLQSLLEASKKVLRYLIEEDADPAMVEMFHNAIKKAEGPADDLTTITLVMTPKTSTVFLEMLSTKVDPEIVEWVQSHIRETKQRTYFRLPIDHRRLKQVHYVLKTTTTPKADKAFKRLADQIESEALSRNPLEVLAEFGL